MATETKTPPPSSVVVVLFNNPPDGRRWLIGVGADRVAAEKLRDDWIGKHDDTYPRENFEFLASPVEGAASVVGVGGGTRVRRRVGLSNGQTLVLEEAEDALHLATEHADGPGEVDAYLASVNVNGVLVLCNSGDANEWLVRGLTGKGA